MQAGEASCWQVSGSTAGCRADPWNFNYSLLNCSFFSFCKMTKMPIDYEPFPKWFSDFTHQINRLLADANATLLQHIILDSYWKQRRLGPDAYLAQQVWSACDLTDLAGRRPEMDRFNPKIKKPLAPKWKSKMKSLNNAKRRRVQAYGSASAPAMADGRQAYGFMGNAQHVTEVNLVLKFFALSFDAGLLRNPAGVLFVLEVKQAPRRHLRVPMDADFDAVYRSARNEDRSEVRGGISQWRFFG